MDIEQVAPELQDAVRRYRALALDRPVMRTLGRVGPRLIRWPVAPGVRISSARAAGVPVRTYLPERRRTDAALLWIHGGGMVIGAPAMDDLLCSTASARLGMRVVSVDYRLAPEHPFPAPLDDCFTVLRRMQDRGPRVGVDPWRIVVGGASAGGGLAAALVQRVHDAGGPLPLGQWLFCPMLDDRTAADRSLDALEHHVWDNRSNRIGWRALLGGEPGGDIVPEYAVPARRTDLSGLPPAWIGVGDIDLFHDEDLEYARRMRTAGGDVTVHVVPGAPHGFEAIAGTTRVAREFHDRAIDWLGELVDGR